ncbi:FAD-dependent monooxygenase [Nocardia sp. R7R-8]|uniref:FAD-dependent monooxygenase n=1 Tax=Nocardia sp. R7R-8 TaxID=3459304 RepID=UPI00403DC327
MKITIIGGGPGGLYLAGLVGERVPEADITVYERNSPEVTYGFGVVFSEPTMRNLREQDPDGFASLFTGAARWPGIDIRIKGELWRCEGNGFAAIERRELLRSLSARAEHAGAKTHWNTEIGPGAPELSDADLVVVANGANSVWRTSRADQLGSSVDTAAAKFIWFGATKVFDGMTFLFEQNEHGWFAVHAYPYNDKASTFVVETDEDTWRRAGLDAFDTSLPPGASDTASAGYLQDLFAEHLDGGHLILNNSRWANFRTVRTRDWRLDDKAVLLGDAAHTAHFSVGSGTKMAMEDALCLAQKVQAVTAGDLSLAQALAEYETERRADVRKVQDAARPSLSWWEHFGQYAEMSPAQFTVHFLTRSGRVGRRRLQRSDPDFANKALTQLLGAPGTSILRSEVEVAGGARSPLRLIALDATQPAGRRADPHDVGDRSATTTEPDAWTIPDLADRVRPGTVREIVIEASTSRAVWACSPAELDGIEDFLSSSSDVLDPAAIVIVDSAAADPADRNAVVEALVAQQRVSEIVRLRLHKTAVLVRRAATADDAATLLIAGRADLVAVPAERVADLLATELAPV